MLVLSRKAGQKVLIGGDIEIIVSRISGNRVTLGIRAPKDLRVLRYELPKHHEESDSKETRDNESNGEQAALTAPNQLMAEGSLMMQTPIVSVEALAPYQPFAR